MTETNKMLEECANYLLNHCFVLGGVEDQRAKYLYVQDHLNEVRAVFAPLGYSVVLYPAPLQAAALVNEVFPTVLLALPDSDLADAAAEVTRTRSELSLYERPEDGTAAVEVEE